jgi:hypothetical protein
MAVSLPVTPPNCVTLPLIVQIRPSLNGVPDPNTLIASFTLSQDNNPLVFSYESVEPNLPLEPGEYFALFTAQGNDSGFLLDNVLLSKDGEPLSYYFANTVHFGYIYDLGIISIPYRVAVRILGSICDSDNDSDNNADCLNSDDIDGVNDTKDAFPFNPMNRLIRMLIE